MNRKESQILDENSQRTKGVDALTSNIEAAKAVAEIVKTTLGPMGMDKMLIDSMGDTVITNDGVKILKEMEIEHPGAKLLVDVAKTQENEVGDGTTTAVILCGELLSKAQELLKQKIHPTTITRTYKIASTKALEILKDCSKEINTSDKKILEKVSSTAMTGKVAEFSKETLSDIIFDSINLVKDEDGVHKHNIKIQKATGGDISESFIFKGIILDKNPANLNMPKKIENPKILLLDFPLEVRELDVDAKVNINSLNEYEQFLKNEEEYLISIVEKIKQSNANVVICQKGIDDNVAYYLGKEGILAVRRTRKSDMEKLSSSLNSKIISNITDINEENTAKGKSVQIKEILDENYIFVEAEGKPKATTIFLKASTTHVLDEIERAVEDALGDINSILKSKRIVAGGGAIEVELHKKLIEYSKTFEGKEQIIIRSYAESFLSIPKILCQNSGFDEIETLTSLISRHEKGDTKSGINSFEGICENTLEKGIIEPINIKSQAIKSATESSSLILRIDDIIAARKLTDKKSFEGEFN